MTRGPRPPGDEEIVKEVARMAGESFLHEYDRRLMEYLAEGGQISMDLDLSEEELEEARLLELALSKERSS